VIMVFERIENELELLERHIIVLQKVIKNAPVGIRKIADETKISKHKIRYSLRVLEHKGMITPTAHGANPTEKAREFQEQLEDKINRIKEKIEELENKIDR